MVPRSVTIVHYVEWWLVPSKHLSPNACSGNMVLSEKEKIRHTSYKKLPSLLFPVKLNLLSAVLCSVRNGAIQKPILIK